MPWAMTAHVIYAAIDDRNPATLSAAVIEDVIRAGIGFNGVLISDDLSMGALRADWVTGRKPRSKPGAMWRSTAMPIWMK